MHNNETISADEALDRLKAGNAAYMNARFNTGDISAQARERTCDEGQNPYAVIIACSDSRVIPESIFMAGIGELFVIRAAGNVIGNYQLGSVEYAVEHLDCRLAVVLGHTHCGAVNAAIHDNPDGYIKFITDEIKRAVGDETDDHAACVKNARQSAGIIESRICTRPGGEEVKVVCAVYRLEDGRVEFI